MHLGRACVEEHRHDLARRRAAHDRVVDDDEALARDLGERVELHADPLLAHALLGLDERAADVAVLDQPLAERDAGRAREADRRRRAGVGDRQHEIGLDRRFGGEALAHAHPRAVHLDAGEARVGPCEVEELEDAERAAVGRLAPPGRVQSLVVDDHELAGSHLALERRADEVECAALRRDDVIVAETAERKRTEAVRVAEGEQLAVGEADDGRGAFETLHARGDGRFERALVVGDQRGDHLGVGARGERLADLLAQRLRVDEVAVVAERDRAHPAVVQERLRVLPGVAARRRVARVPDRELAVEAGEAALVEHLRHEAEVAHRGQAPAFRDGDSRGLLAAVLERVEAEVAEARDVTAGRADSEDAAHQATCPSSTTSSHGMLGAGRHGGDDAEALDDVHLGAAAPTSRPPRAARARRRRRRRRG